MNKNESKYFNTAKAMNDALIILLERKDFEYITIKEICDKAGVNRSTFYLHYSNTNDLLEEVIQSLNNSFVSHFNNNESIFTIISKGNLNELYLINDKYLMPYLEFIKENKRVYKAVHSHPQLFKTNSIYNRFFTSLFVPILKRFGEEEKWHKYIMDFYICGISSIVSDWVLDDCKIPTKEIASFIEGLVKNHDKKGNKIS